MRSVLTFLMLSLSTADLAGAAETDFFAELPVVLSVSRLAQPLDETPGAVTVIDRDTIRRSGARELAELLRLVPGFIVSHFDGGARPFAIYHGDYDAFNRHLQVYVDGRSVYSGLLLGTATYGMMGVVLEDIERIEVLRGSNSAAYGANAFLGVVNIVTRHAEDSVGEMVLLRAGQQGVADATVRLGRAGDGRAFRLTLETRRDDGFDGSDDDKQVDQLHFRGDLRLGGGDELTFNAGLTHFDWSVEANFPMSRGTASWQHRYAHVQWRRALSETGDLRVNALVDREAYAGFVPFVSGDGETGRSSLDIQHTFAPAQGVRAVWGGEYRREEIQSPDLFTTHPDQSNHLWRLYGNLEWRPHPDWLVNAGGLWEWHSIIGGHTAPRLTVNYHLSRDHTVRLGTTTAYKLPTQFELRGDWRFMDIPLILATGGARPERIDAHEVGYLGHFPALALTADLRVFEEQVESILRQDGRPEDYVNKSPSLQRGWEAELRWKPWPDTEVRVNHTDLRLRPDPVLGDHHDRYRAPRTIDNLMLFQRLPGDFDLSLLYSRVGTMFYVRQRDSVPAYSQLDARLAKGFRLGGTRAELAVVAQAVDGAHIDFTPAHRLDRRVFATFRLGM